MASGRPSRLWPRLQVFAHAMPRLLVGRRRQRRIGRILVAHHLLLGDTIMLAGLFKKLRRDYPEALIDVLVPVAWMPIFSGAPYGVRALSYDPRSLAGHRKLLAHGPYLGLQQQIVFDAVGDGRREVTFTEIRQRRFQRVK